MAISSSGYASINREDRLHQELSSLFSGGIQANSEKLNQIDGIKTAMNWYKEQERIKEENQYESSYSRNFILTILANKAAETLVEHAQPFYVKSIIQKIGIKTQFKEGAVEINLRIGFLPLKPYVEFVKEVNHHEEPGSVKPGFQLDTNTHIEKLKIRSTRKGEKSIDIEKIGIGLELYLLEVRIMSLPVASFKGKSKVGRKKF